MDEKFTNNDIPTKGELVIAFLTLMLIAAVRDIAPTIYLLNSPPPSLP